MMFHVNYNNWFIVILYFTVEEPPMQVQISAKEEESYIFI